MFEKLKLYTPNGRLDGEDYDDVVACEITEWEDFALFKKFCKEIDVPIVMPCCDDRDLVDCFVKSIGRNGDLKFVPLSFSSTAALKRMN